MGSYFSDNFPKQTDKTEQTVPYMDPFPFESLPNELKVQVLSKLDHQSLRTVALVCKQWNELIGPTTWKELSIRDWPEFLQTCPMKADTLYGPSSLEAEELAEQAYSRQKQGENDNEKSSDGSFAFCGMNGLIFGQEQDTDFHNSIVDWKSFYNSCLQTINLSGLWIAEYGVHGEELINVNHQGFVVLATKVTGDVNVPAGKTSFLMLLNRTCKVGRGRMHLADTGYKNPRWGKASIDVINNDKFNICWYIRFALNGASHTSGWYTVTLEFRRAQQEDEKRLLSDANNTAQSQMRLLHRLLSQVDVIQNDNEMEDVEESDFEEDPEEEHDPENDDEFYEM